jgi:surface protein
MFYGCHAFNQPLNSWNVSNVTNMCAMFAHCHAFNQPLNSWNVSNVTNMNGMFYECRAFHQPLNSWNVSNVTNMSDMFAQCHAFNQPLNSWNVSSVAIMCAMFYECRAFHQVLPWKLRVGVNTDSMFDGSHGSLLKRRSPGTIRRHNGELAHSIIKRSNHPNMMRFDDDHLSPIEADAPDYTRRLMANVRKKSPELLMSTTTRRKRSRSRSQSESRKRSPRK